MPREVKFLKINISTRHVLTCHVSFQRHQGVSPICCSGTKTLCLPAERRPGWGGGQQLLSGQQPATCLGRAGNELSLCRSLGICEGMWQALPLPQGWVGPQATLPGCVMQDGGGGCKWLKGAHGLISLCVDWWISVGFAELLFWANGLCG